MIEVKPFYDLIYNAKVARPPIMVTTPPYDMISSALKESLYKENSYVAFLTNPTHIEHLRRLAEKGVRLPQKATFFYPNLLSGLVINKFGL